MRTAKMALALMCGLLGCAPIASHAQTYPNRVIKMIVPFPAGGGGDVLARIVTHYMSEDLGQQIVVMNQPGASGALAFQEVARTDPDGYTLIWASTGFPVMAATIQKLAFNPATDFTHIAKVAENPFILVVNPDLPVKNVADLLALAKAKPNTLNFAHNGPGTLSKLTLALFQLQAGIEVGDVSYRGDNFSIADVVAGHVQGMFSNSSVALPHIADGKVRGLAVTSAKRSDAAPDLPTLQEAGLADFKSVAWHGISGPAGIPRPIVDRLNASIVKAMANPDVIARSKGLGVDPDPSTPDQFQDLVAKELVYWASVAKRAEKAGKF
jgi:tripartite-type tricarboxylate transporter receptor subunit TctC